MWGERIAKLKRNKEPKGQDVLETHDCLCPEEMLNVDEKETALRWKNNEIKRILSNVL